MKKQFALISLMVVVCLICAGLAIFSNSRPEDDECRVIRTGHGVIFLSQTSAHNAANLDADAMWRIPSRDVAAIDEATVAYLRTKPFWKEQVQYGYIAQYHGEIRQGKRYVRITVIDPTTLKSFLTDENPAEVVDILGTLADWPYWVWDTNDHTQLIAYDVSKRYILEWPPEAGVTTP